MRRQDGFTLLEIIMAQVIIVVMLAVGYMLLQMITDSFTSSVQTSQTVFSVQESVHQMGKYIREAQDAETGGYLLEQVDDNELVFYSDIDQDGETERVRFVLSGDVIQRGVVEPVGDPASYDLGSETVTTVVEQVAMEGEPVFGYYNENWPDPSGNPLPPAERLLETRYIAVTVRVEDTTDLARTYHVLTDGVQLRNAKTN